MFDPEKIEKLLKSDYLQQVRFIALTSFGMGMVMGEGLVNGVHVILNWVRSLVKKWRVR